MGEGQKKALLLLAVAVGASTWSGVSYAQDAGAGVFRRDRNISVRDRPKPEYEPLGITMGGFRLFPEASLALDYSDNVFATKTNEEADTALVAELAAELKSNWNTHELHAGISTRSRHANDFDSLDYDDWAANAGGRLDIVRGFSVYGDVGYTDAHQDIWNSGTGVNLAEPIPYTLLSAHLGTVKTFNRVRVRGEYEYLDYDFSDTAMLGGGFAEEDNRDHKESTASARVDYALSPSLAVFVSGAYNWRDYDLAPPNPAAPVNRDSSGYEALVGVSFEFSRLLRGDVGIGYLSQNYDAPGVSNSSDFAYDAKLEWFLDELLTLTFAGSSSVQDSDVSTASSYISNDISVRADYEYRRNILLSAEVGYAKDDYQAVTREYERTRVELGADYLLNRTASAFLQLAHFDQSSNEIGGREFTANRVMLGLRLRR